MRLETFKEKLKNRRIDAALVFKRENIRALTGLDCDDACLEVTKNSVSLYTDFRYYAMVRRLRPEIEIRDVRNLAKGALRSAARVGFESSIAHSRFTGLSQKARKAKFIDIEGVISGLREVKTEAEIALISKAERVTLEVWKKGSSAFRPGMTEIDMARILKKLMLDSSDGEAFETIVCVGANAAECHHVPDKTIWSGKEPILVDMGVKIEGVCSDLTRNLVPAGVSREYRRIYSIVSKANRAAIAAARPGIACKELDAISRGIIAENGYGDYFGHSLGHGVGYEIHEAPAVSAKNETVLEPGMVVTIEPGIYIEGKAGVRIEDLIVITDTGCKVLSR